MRVLEGHSLRQNLFHPSVPKSSKRFFFIIPNLELVSSSYFDPSSCTSYHTVHPQRTDESLIWVCPHRKSLFWGVVAAAVWG